MPPATEDLRDVELVSVGTWAASTGVTTITRADLEAMLAAAQDTDLDAPAVRIGHVDPRFDGEPAAGWVQLTRIVDVRKDGKRVPTLVGNVVGMPAKLAQVAPTAFRRRSVEIAWRVRTAGGKAYPAVLTGLALLGVAPPAVKGLADVLALYTADPEQVGATDNAGVDTLEVVDGLEDNPAAVAMLTAARLAGATPDQVDAMAAAATGDTRNVPPPATVPADDGKESTSTPTEEPHTMTKRTLTDQELAELIGREADVDVEATIAQIRATETPTPAPSGDPVTDPTQTADPSPQTPPQPEHPATGQPAAEEPQLVTLSAGTWAEVQREVEWARNERRRQLLDNATTEGRIAPAERAAFAAQLARDEEGTTALLSSLPTRYSTTTLSHAAAPEVEPDAAAWDEFSQSLNLDGHQA